MSKIADRFINVFFKNRLGGADCLGLIKHRDGVWTLEKLDWDGEVGGYWGRKSDNFYSAEGVGADPGRFMGIPIAVGYEKFGQLLSLPNCRIARNVRQGKMTQPEFEEDPETGQEVAVSDGGEAIVEEKAVVAPEDVALLGGNEDISDKINTIEQRAINSAHMPDGGMLSNFKDVIIVLGSVYAGYWMRGQAGGGGGGGSALGGITDTFGMSTLPFELVDGLLTASLGVL